MSEALPPPRRPSRLGLYLPIALLALLACGWSIAWFVIRSQATAGLDEWIRAEAADGRRWTCKDRTVGGYPFRIEIGCSEFTVQRPDVSASLGRLLVVSQIYKPKHIIAEASGPLHLTAGSTQVDATWRLMQASVILNRKTFDIISISAEDPAISGREANGIGWEASSKHFEAHLRPKPDEPTAMDLSMTSRAAKVPGLDAAMGGSEAADIVTDLTVTETDDLPARPIWGELERWRAANGVARLTGLLITKGNRRLEGSGQVSIDARHRPEGQLDLSAANLGGALGQLTAGGGGLLGALLGGRPPEGGAAAGLKPLPPLRIQDGRLLVGPLPIPGVRIPSLY